VGPFADATAYGMLAAVAARDGEREAIVFDGQRLTFSALLARIDTFAAGLAALGLGKGDALGIWLPNRPLGTSRSTRPPASGSWSSPSTRATAPTS